ncbi:hypothetical protein V8G69_00290 [Gaetbulibacter sp. M235]|uniref:hypothetical protein n=1 Tax=Gaetbulibacter sp. M235 TaxID=3126510 RepID=UPI00374F8AA0
MHLNDNFYYIAALLKLNQGYCCMNEVNYQYVNLQSLKEDTFGDESILKEIMGLFIELIDEYTSILNKELPHKNWQALFQATHKIKPNIFMFGISSLEKTILELDLNFRNEVNLETVDCLVDYAILILEEVKNELITELKLMTDE